MEGFRESSLDWLSNAKGTDALVWTSTTGRRDRAAERLASGLTRATIYADSERLLDNGNGCRRDSALLVSISNGEPLGERSLYRLSDAESTRASVRLSTTRCRYSA